MPTAYYKNSSYVKLTSHEIKHCVDHGIEKEKDSRKRNLQNKHGCTFTPTESMYNSCCADITEAAVAVMLGWPIKLTIGTFSVPDLEGNIQVKAITKSWHGLTIRDDNPGNWRMVGVNLDLREYPTVESLYQYDRPIRIAGWMEASEARQLVMMPANYEWRTDFGNGREMVTAVPQNHLHPMIDLRNALNEEGFRTTSDRLVPGRLQ